MIKEQHVQFGDELIFKDGLLKIGAKENVGNVYRDNLYGMRCILNKDIPKNEA